MALVGVSIIHRGGRQRTDWDFRANLPVYRLHFRGASLRNKSAVVDAQEQGRREHQKKES